MITEYTIYFELFGKKLKTTVVAESIEDAKKKVADKIIFHKVEKKIDSFLEHLKTMCGI